MKPEMYYREPALDVSIIHGSKVTATVNTLQIASDNLLNAKLLSFNSTLSLRGK